MARWPPVGISVAPASGGNRAPAFKPARLDIALSVPHQQFVAYSEVGANAVVTATPNMAPTAHKRPPWAPTNTHAESKMMNVTRAKEKGWATGPIKI